MAVPQPDLRSAPLDLAAASAPSATPPPPPASPLTAPAPPPSDAQAITAVAALIAVGAAPSLTATKIIAVLKSVGFSESAIRFAVSIAFTAPVIAISAASRASASQQTALSERTYRAAYIFYASRRISKAFREGAPAPATLRQERDNFRQHLLAAKKRREAGVLVDRSAARYGKTLGWYAKMDARTTAECREANGKNFQVDQRPPFGYPGTVHPHCRCTPGPPHRNAGTVYDRKKAKAS